MKLPLITIYRAIKEDFGVYGLLESSGFQCFTIEPPDLGNTPWVSCIPAGLYKAHRDEFSKANPPYPDLRFYEVPGRSDIEVHAAILPSQLSGCVATVESLKWADGVIRGFNSKLTLSALLQSFDTDDVYILIRE